MTLVLTQFSKPPLAPVDFSEKAAGFCLLPLRLACGKLVRVSPLPAGGNDYSRNTDPGYICRSALIDCLGRFFIGLFALSIALPLTAAGAIFALCSSTHQNSVREYALFQRSAGRLPPPPADKAPDDPHAAARALLRQDFPNSEDRADAARSQTLKAVFKQATLTREQAREMRGKLSEDLGAPPEDFENTLRLILNQGSFKRAAISKDQKLSAKIQKERIAERLIALAPDADAETLPRYATALYFLDHGYMAAFLKALSPQGTQLAALAVSPRQLQNQDVPIRHLLAEAIPTMVQAKGRGVTDRTYASMFLAVCDPAWVAGAFDPEVWTACAEGYSGNSLLEPLGTLACLAKQQYYSPLSNRRPIEQFFQNLFFDQRIYILQLPNEQGLPLPMNGDEAEQPLLTAFLESCSVQRIRAAFGNQEYRQKFLGSSYMLRKAPAALWRKFGQAFPS